MRDQYRFWETIATRWNDMDPMNHVNSATYFVYFEIARMNYLEQLGLRKLKVPGKVGPAVVSQTCNYKQQVFHPSVVEVGVRSTDLRARTFTVAYDVYLKDTDTLVCDGHTVMAWVDYENAKAIPVPDVLRAAIQDYDGVEPA